MSEYPEPSSAPAAKHSKLRASTAMPHPSTAGASSSEAASSSSLLEAAGVNASGSNNNSVMSVSRANNADESSDVSPSFLSKAQLRALKRARGLSSNPSVEDLTSQINSTTTAVPVQAEKTASDEAATLHESPLPSSSEGIDGKPERKRDRRIEKRRMRSGDEERNAESVASASASAATYDRFDINTLNPSMLIEEIKMVLCVRKDLKMGVGKMCAQCAHAAVAAVTAQTKDDRVKMWYALWDEYCGTKKIAVQIPDESAMSAVVKMCRQLGIPSHVVRDAGRTQVEAGTATVVAVGPAPSSLVDKVTLSFKLL